MATPDSRFIVSAENRASQVLKQIGNDFGKLNLAASSLKSMLAGLGAGISAGALVAFAKQAVDVQDSFGKMAQQVGVGVDALTELDFAAKLSDVSTEELGSGLTRLTARMADVAQGGKEAQAAFDTIGVKVKNADGTMRAADDVFKDIADRFSEMEDGSAKTALAVEIFGRAGAKLIPLLNSGSSGLSDMASEARRLGISFGEDASKAAEEFNDNLTRLQLYAGAAGRALVNDLLPSLISVTSKLIDAARAAEGFWKGLAVWASVPGSYEDNPLQAVGELEGAIARLKKMRDELDPNKSFANKLNDWVFGDVGDLDKQIAVQEARLGYVRLLAQRQIDGWGLDSPPGRKKPAPKITPPDNTKKKPGQFEDPLFDLLQELDRVDAQRQAAADKALDALKSQEAAAQSAEQAEISRLQKISEEWRKATDVTLEFQQKYEDVMRAIQIGPSQGGMTEEEGALARFLIGNETDGLFAKLDEAKVAMDEFAVEAARNIQDTLGDELFDVLDGNFDNIGKSFGNMLKRMAAEAMAADLGRLILGDYAKTGQVGGLAGGLFNWLSSMIPGHADGLDYVPYDNYIARLHKGERVLTAEEARSGGGVVVNQVNNFGSGVDRSQMGAFARRIQESTIASIRDAQLRNDPMAG